MASTRKEGYKGALTLTENALIDRETRADHPAPPTPISSAAWRRTTSMRSRCCSTGTACPSIGPRWR